MTLTHPRRHQPDRHVRRRWRPGLAAVVLTAGIASQAGAEPPSFEAITGHRFGERITLHHQMEGWLEALAATSPRIQLVDQGTSWEGRRLLAVVVTSEGNLERLEEVRSTAELFDDPRAADAAEVDRRLARQPVIVWLGGSIHGNELSGSEGLMRVLERLATDDDEATRQVLEAVVVIVDPMLNPDGRDAFAVHNQRREGAEPNPRRDHWSSDGTRFDAQGFRTGHYYFDTNRDWFAQTQRETRGRAATLRGWRPQVVIDAHEMGADAEFYFDPADDPWPEHFPPFARRGFDLFNAAYAAAFDAAGFEYMTGERYNYYYPGYTTSWGSYQGAVGMLYEQGSSRGLALERADGSVRTLRDALEQQATAAWTALETAAARRQELLVAYVDAQRQAVAAGRRGVRRYLIGGGDPGHRRALARLLLRNGIEVGTTTGPLRIPAARDRVGAAVERVELPAGTLVVEAAQPRHHLLRTLLEPGLEMPAAFLEEARRRIDRGEGARFYDITAWSLPLLFDLEAYSVTEAAPPEVEPFMEPRPPTLPRAGYAYLVDGRTAASMAVLHQLVREGARAAILTRASEIAGEVVADGTVIVRTGQNPETVHGAVQRAVERFGTAARAVDTGLATAGRPSLGSGEAVPVRRSRIALVAGEPVQGYSFGWAWWVLDRQYGIPTTVLRAAALGSTPLDEHDVIVLPHLRDADALASSLGEEGLSRLRRWVADGGTLVAIGEAVELARRHLDLLALRSWVEENTEGEGDEAVRPRTFGVPGAILRTQLDLDAWLATGYDADELPFLVDSDRVFLEPLGPPSASRRVVARYATDPLLLSGHAWPESLERLPGAVAVYVETHGRGRVIAFAEDPNYRGYFHGADRLFLNAVVLGPSAR